MNRVQLGLAVACAALLGAAAATGVFDRRTTVPTGPLFEHDVRPGPGVTRTTRLSAYNPGLAGTPGDTAVYVLHGRERGGTAVVLGGTHGNEIAGIVAAVVLVEHASVSRGRVIVVPHANNSAVSYTDPVRPGPEWITIGSGSGARRFKYGARRTNPEHQGTADPLAYRHPAADEALSGHEARNLARVYPGTPDGQLTQRIAAAIVGLVTDEGAGLVLDLHEAEPDSPHAWAILAHPRDFPIAAAATRRLAAEGLDMLIEASLSAPRGISYREISHSTSARTFLVETPNPAQVSRPEGIDVVHHPELPLARRVGAQLSAIRAVLDAHNDQAAHDDRIEVRNLPRFAEVVSEGVGTYLRE